MQNGFVFLKYSLPNHVWTLIPLGDNTQLLCRFRLATNRECRQMLRFLGNHKAIHRWQIVRIWSLSTPIKDTSSASSVYIE